MQDRNDIVVVHHIQEAYFNCTHQTLEMFRFAAVDSLATHILKVRRPKSLRKKEIKKLRWVVDSCFANISVCRQMMTTLCVASYFWGNSTKCRARGFTGGISWQPPETSKGTSQTYIMFRGGSGHRMIIPHSLGWRIFFQLI